MTHKTKLDKKAFHLTPVGTAHYPRLIEPDKQFKKQFGEYSVWMRFSPEDEAALVMKVDAMYEVAYQESCDEYGPDQDRGTKPYKADKDSEALHFHFKKNGGGLDRNHTRMVFSHLRCDPIVPVVLPRFAPLDAVQV